VTPNSEMEPIAATLKVGSFGPGAALRRATGSASRSYCAPLIPLNQPAMEPIAAT